MLVNTKDIAKGIQAVKQPRQKAIAVSVKKGQLLLRGGLEAEGFSATWRQPVAKGTADVDEVLLEHKVLSAIARAAPDEVSIALSDTGIHLWTDSPYLNAAFWKFNALDALDGLGDQPSKPLPVGGKIKLRFDIPINRFREIVKLLTASASSDDTRPILRTALIAHDGEQLVACATDTYRLRIIPIGKYCTKGSVDLGDWTQIETFPMPALKAAASAVAKLPKKYPDPVRIQLRSKAWTASCGPFRLVSGYGGDLYPGVSKVIPSRDDTVWALTVDAEELRNALMGLAPIAASDGNRVTFDWQGGEVIVLKARADDVTSEAEVRLPCSVKSRKKKWAVAFSCQYLLDGIAGREGEVTIEQAGGDAKWGNTSPGLLDFEADGLYVVMPMMIM